MNRSKHLTPYALAALVAIMLVGALGRNPLAAGIGLAFLLCPLVMGVVMWLLMRQPGRSTSSSQPAEQDAQRNLEQSSTGRLP